MKTITKHSPSQLMTIVTFLSYFDQMTIHQKISEIDLTSESKIEKEHILIKTNNGIEKWELVSVNQRKNEKFFKHPNHPGITVIAWKGVRIQLDDLVGPYRPIHRRTIPRLSDKVIAKITKSGLIKKYPLLLHLVEFIGYKKGKKTKQKETSIPTESEFLDEVD